MWNIFRMILSYRYATTEQNVAITATSIILDGFKYSIAKPKKIDDEASSKTHNMALFLAFINHHPF